MLRERPGYRRHDCRTPSLLAPEQRSEGLVKEQWENYEPYHSWSLQRVGKHLTLPNRGRKSLLNMCSFQEKLQKVNLSSQAVSRVKSTEDLKNILPKSQLHRHVTHLLTTSNALKN